MIFYKDCSSDSAGVSTRISKRVSAGLRSHTRLSNEDCFQIPFYTLIVDFFDKHVNQLALYICYNQSDNIHKQESDRSVEATPN